MQDKKPIIIDMKELDRNFKEYHPESMDVTVNANGYPIEINITAKEVYIFFYAKAKEYIVKMVKAKKSLAFDESMLDMIAEFQIEPSTKPETFNNWILHIASDAYDAVRFAGLTTV